MENHKMSLKDFCCKKMYSEQKEISDDTLVDHSVEYNERYREYFIQFNEEERHPDEPFTLLTHVFYCPWCGTKLPTSLADEWWDVLENEYGLQDPVHDDREKVPAEFWTDEWWKKRGL